MRARVREVCVRACVRACVCVCVSEQRRRRRLACQSASQRKSYRCSNSGKCCAHVDAQRQKSMRHAAHAPKSRRRNQAAPGVERKQHRCEKKSAHL
eukprot:3206266-Pleurochrysis_carterae.AAC.1